MKIVHIAPNAPYNDNWGYQDNLLPKYQRKAGHDVAVIVTTQTHRDGRVVEIDPDDYVTDDGVRVIRLKKKSYSNRVLTFWFAKLEVYPYLEEIRPDLVFFHGLSSITIYDAVRYKKKRNPNCVIVRDSHVDYNNCVKLTGIKKILLQGMERYFVRSTMPYVSRVYGVTPWRKQFAEEYFRVPPEKTDVLIMGADDELLNIGEKDRLRAEVRKQYGISDSDFLVVTGGKIDGAKKIDLLMEVCAELDGVKLLVFGNVSDDIREKFDELCASTDRITYIGWVDSGDVYRYFFAADLVCFPGGHSVMWEQACASKVPCLFKKWDGMEHLNNGGNSDFLDPVTKETIQEKITSLRFTPAYDAMKKTAESDATDVYLYSRIAEKSVECAEKI